MVRRVTPRVWGTALSAETAMKYPVSWSADGHTCWMLGLFPFSGMAFCHNDDLIALKYIAHTLVWLGLFYAKTSFEDKKMAMTILIPLRIL